MKITTIIFYIESPQSKSAKKFPREILKSEIFFFDIIYKISKQHRAKQFYIRKGIWRKKKNIIMRTKTWYISTAKLKTLWLYTFLVWIPVENNINSFFNLHILSTKTSYLSSCTLMCTYWRSFVDIMKPWITHQGAQHKITIHVSVKRVSFLRVACKTL